MLRLRSYNSLAPESGAAISISVAIEPMADGFSGQLTVVTSLQTVTRRLSDTNCDALLDALALIAAIATDPAHRKVSAPYKPNAGTSKPIRVDVRVGSGAIWTVGGTVGLESAATPVVLRTIGTYVSARRHDFGMTAHYSATLGFGRTEWLPYRLGDAKFTWLAGRFAACPVGSSLRGFSYGGCAIMELGRLKGSGVSDVGPTSSGGVWLALGLGITTNVVIGRIHLGFLGSVVSPLVRDHFYFAPDETVFRASGIGLAAEMRLGWVIW